MVSTNSKIQTSPLIGFFVVFIITLIAIGCIRSSEPPPLPRAPHSSGDSTIPPIPTQQTKSLLTVKPYDLSIPAHYSNLYSELQDSLNAFKNDNMKIIDFYL